MSTRTLVLSLFVALSAVTARAQVDIHIELGLPVVPSLVVVQPGIQVVEGFREEVFFHRGWYWCRRPNGWYRSRTPHARFEWLETRRVPAGLVRVPVGHYRNWHHEARPGERREAEHERREERRRELKEERRDERRDREKHRRGREKKEHEHHWR